MNDEEIKQLNQDIDNGKEAERLIGNPLLMSIIYSRKVSASESFMTTAPNDDKGRKEAWHKAQAAIALEGDLQQIVEQGKIAKKLLDEQDRFTQTNNNPLGE